jgi:hypothetical protein
MRSHHQLDDSYARSRGALCLQRTGIPTKSKSPSRGTHAKGITMKRILVYGITAISLSGCSLFQTGISENKLDQAASADHYCRSQGYHYPQSQYLGCRLDLANQKRERQYNQLQILDQGSTPANDMPAPHERNYTPLSANHFKCRSVVRNKRKYVLCAENNG